MKCHLGKWVLECNRDYKYSHLWAHTTLAAKKAVVKSENHEPYESIQLEMATQ